MLRTLSIRNYAIVDRLELDFKRGFTVLTGETGAGKSILVDALALVLGARAESLVVKQGAERAEISAEFDVDERSPLAAWLEERALAMDGACLLRRVVDAGGRARAFINGTPATLSQLREAGQFLVEIHGQHEHQSLVRAGAQRDLVDAFGEMQHTATRTADLYREWRGRVDQRVTFERDAAAVHAEREQLEWQLKELEALDFSLGGWQELQAEHGRLAHAASLIEGAQFGLDALSEGEAASLPQLNAVVSRLESLVEYDPSLREVLEVLEPAAIQIQEAVYSLRHYQQKVDVDPQRLRDSERRLDIVHSACRKYRAQPETLPAVLERARSRLAELDAAGDPDTLRRLEQAALAAYMEEAEKLSVGRRKASAKLSSEVTAAMQALAMSGGVFEAVLSVLNEPAAYGLEQIEFRVSAHQSIAPQPLSKVASGGELSRLSLAIQTVAVQMSRVPTLIFDEVDTGIGGRVAEIVGKMLKQIGGQRQVMCITHLPQVAASADHQWRVAKTTSKTKVQSQVVALDADQRIDEIARMLGGLKITETTRKHAAEMLDFSRRVNK